MTAAKLPTKDEARPSAATAARNGPLANFWLAPLKQSASSDIDPIAEVRMVSKPGEYRAQALHCRLMADQVKSPLDKEIWLGLAADSMKMASVHERFATGQTKSEDVPVLLRNRQTG